MVCVDLKQPKFPNLTSNLILLKASVRLFGTLVGTHRHVRYYPTLCNKKKVSWRRQIGEIRVGERTICHITLDVASKCDVTLRPPKKTRRNSYLDR